MKKKPFLVLWIALLLSGAIVAGLGAFLKYTVCKPLGIYQDESIITLPFVMLSGKNPQAGPGKKEPTLPTSPTQPSTQPPTTATVPTEPSTSPTEAPTTLPPTEPLPHFQVPEYRVDESYFDDVLFVGDSRTCGLRDYNRLGKADYFCNVGMTVFSVLGDTASDESFSAMTLTELLSQRTYGKIYIALGINECGYDVDTLMESFHTLIDRIEEYQPDAIVVVTSIMTVGRGKAASASYFSIENLAKINTALSGLADNKTVFYLDVNEAFADEEGYLPDYMSSDGCHLYGEYYENWCRWLCSSVAELNKAIAQ